MALPANHTANPPTNSEAHEGTLVRDSGHATPIKTEPSANHARNGTRHRLYTTIEYTPIKIASRLMLTGVRCAMI